MATTARYDFIKDDNKIYKLSDRWREINTPTMRRIMISQMPFLPFHGDAPSSGSYRGGIVLDGLSEFSHIRVQTFNTMKRFLMVEVNAVAGSGGCELHGGGANEMSHGDLCFIKKNGWEPGSSSPQNNIWYFKYQMHFQTDNNTTIIVLERNVGRWPHPRYRQDWMFHTSFTPSDYALFKAHANDTTAGNTQTSAVGYPGSGHGTGGVGTLSKWSQFITNCSGSAPSSILPDSTATAKFTMAQVSAYGWSASTVGDHLMFEGRAGYPRLYWQNLKESRRECALAIQSEVESAYWNAYPYGPDFQRSEDDYYKEYSGTGAHSFDSYSNTLSAGDERKSIHPGSKMYPFAYIPGYTNKGPYGHSPMAGYYEDPTDTMRFAWTDPKVSSHHSTAQSGWPYPHYNWTNYRESSAVYGLTDSDVAFQNKGFAGLSSNTTSDGANNVTAFKVLSADVFIDCYRKPYAKGGKSFI